MQFDQFVVSLVYLPCVPLMTNGQLKDFEGSEIAAISRKHHQREASQIMSDKMIEVSSRRMEK
jgi:hypothetical protein